jgi:hypothetical protein
MTPSDFFRRSVVLSFQEDAIGVRLRELIGVDSMMWGSVPVLLGKGTSDRRHSKRTRSKMNPTRSRSRDYILFMPPLRTGLDVLEYEIRQEQAATMGRLAGGLRDALDALDIFDRRAKSGKSATDSRDPQRMRLVDAAADALWNFVVQRECSGLRWTEQVLKDYGIPIEVHAKMGAVRPR